jgi:hypothetical protein
LNIWIGITVKGAKIHSNSPAGGSPVSGALGRKAMKVSAPMVILGADAEGQAEQVSGHDGFLFTNSESRGQASAAA